MRVAFVERESAPERLVCEGEIVFESESGPLAGMKLVGFSLWRSPEGEVYVTFPSRAFGTGGERRFFDYLRSVEGTPVAVAVGETDVQNMYMTIDPTTVPAGTVTFTVVNEGVKKHEFVILSTDVMAGDLPLKNDEVVEELVVAATMLASQRTGAIIAVERDIGLRNYIEGGIPLDATLTYDLLLSIFQPRSPLHDGAVIVHGGRIAAAACFLPLTVNPELSRTLGSRHRAAIGLSEDTDAVAIVVSEESGTVSVVEGGRIRRGLDGQALRHELHRSLGLGADPAIALLQDRETRHHGRLPLIGGILDDLAVEPRLDGVSEG